MSFQKGIVAVMIGASLGLAGIGQASADSILFESRPGNNMSFATPDDYVTNWNGLSGGPGYGSASVMTWDYPVQGNVDNHELIPSGSMLSIAYHYHVDFDVDASEAGNWDFRLAPDFGLGGAAYLDGVNVGYNPNDMWWGLDWNNSSQQFLFSSIMAAGQHTLDMYGQEFCCDGPTGGEYSAKGGPYQPFTSVPEPSGIATCLGGLLILSGIVVRRRRA